MQFIVYSTVFTFFSSVLLTTSAYPSFPQGNTFFYNAQEDISQLQSTSMLDDAVVEWLEEQLMMLTNEADTPDCPLDPGITIPKVEPGKSTDTSFPTCAAFVMDLTGSMTDEIRAIKQVLSNFLTSQLNAGNDYCYIFLKVIGPGQGKKAFDDI